MLCSRHSAHYIKMYHLFCLSFYHTQYHQNIQCPFSYTCLVCSLMPSIIMSAQVFVRLLLRAWRKHVTSPCFRIWEGEGKWHGQLNGCQMLARESRGCHHHHHHHHLLTTEGNSQMWEEAGKGMVAGRHGMGSFLPLPIIRHSHLLPPLG